MRAAILSGPGNIHLVDKQERAPKPQQVQVAVSYVAICGSDIARFDGRLPSPKQVVFGHEFSGRVQTLGECVTGLAVGQSVTVAPLLNCGRCSYCLADKGYLCSERKRFGTDVDGALSEFVNVPAARAFPLPEDLPLAHGALAEPLAIGVHAVRRASNIKGKHVLVLGGGAIGLFIAIFSQLEGAKETIVIDIDSSRVEFAESLGFTGSDGRSKDLVNDVLEQTNNLGADLVFEASGSPAVGPYLMPLLAPLGTIVVVGRIEEPVPMNFDDMLMKEATINTSRYFSLSDFQLAVELISSGNIPAEALIEGRFPFHRLDEKNGASMMDAARRAIRLMVVLRDQ